MQFLFMALFALGITAADQLVKLWVVGTIGFGARIEAVPGVFHLTNVRNTGAAFSALQGMQWLFALVFLAFTAALLWEFFKKRLPFTNLERWYITAIYAGGLGNMIDRLRLGYVVDMIEVDFMRFPVFNVADCFITCGCILLLTHLVFFNRSFWKDDKK